ncbi:MAG: Tad secretion system assembly platform protein TadB [Idiomarinaceae bacterium HL-53]|nr:MAG: Tad secretion system assembly platform protein TadB [Idiomarinaceae bacterium HL-53]CUS48809.1 tight adherence protein B [Idiomarinaceae bacterium HL-53]
MLWLGLILISIVCGTLGSWLVSHLQHYLTRIERDYELQLQQNLWDVFVFVSPRRLLVLWTVIGLIAGSLVWIMTQQWIAATILLFSFWSLPPFLVSKYRIRRITAMVEQLPDVSMMIVTTLRSGGTLLGGIDFAQRHCGPPFSQELALLLRKIRVGTPLVTGLEEMSQRLDNNQVRRWCSILKLGINSGGNQSMMLSQLATNMRSKKRLERRVKSLSAQGNMQGKVMAILPFFIGGILFLIEPKAMFALFESAVGWGLLGAQVGLVSLGLWWMSKLIRIEVSL